jgi:K+ transporter
MTIQPAARIPLRRAVITGAPGVVFGDIGTSPIYTFRECLKSSGNAGNEAVLGLLSLVFWALMVVVTTKYVCFVMGADNDCEGGIIALLALASAAVVDPTRAVRVRAWNALHAPNRSSARRGASGRNWFEGSTACAS